MHVNENVVFIFDSSQKIVYFNEPSLKIFPNMALGKSCCEATGTSPLQCEQCPVRTGKPETMALYNIIASRWLNMSFASMEYPGHGLCTVVTGSFYQTLRKEVLGRVKFMNQYDFIIEMNLTIDRYVMLSDSNYGKEVVLEEEPLSVLIKRTAETMVHPDDYRKFTNLFNLNTLSERLKAAKFPLTEVIREKNTRGTYDDVKITLIPEEIHQNGYEMFIALFHIDNLKKKTGSDSDRNGITGLLNKESFIKETSVFLGNYHDDVALIYMDIEHFRLFNKWYSRWQGDRLLKSIGLFLLQMDRMFGTVSGYDGGDNFFILCDKQDVVLEYLVNGLNELISCFDGIEGFRMAYGGYLIEDKREDMQDALDLASTACTLDMSLSVEKIRWYNESLILEEEKEILIIPDFERGLEENEFTFFLQPKCSIREDRIVGAEALVRWNHKIKGFISPGEFIPILERKGLLSKLDIYIWEQVCKKISEWQTTGLELVPVSINVSRIDIFNMDVPEVLINLTKKYNVDPDLIEVEITESAFVNDSRIIKTVIQRLRKAGFKILIDDFGSGYSSLNMLKDVQADVIKMDIKFFDLNQENFDKGYNIITSMYEMSHNIGLPIIAEGVETQNQIDLLEDIGFNYVQGYYYYKPLQLKDYEDIISDKDKISHDGLQL